MTQDYTRGAEVDLPADASNLDTAFTAGDYTAVSLDDGSRVAQGAATGEYSIFQFKDTSTGKTGVSVTWNGQSDVATTTNPVRLQVFNVVTSLWETLDTESLTAANTDFDLTGAVSNLTNYKDGSDYITCRVYQASRVATLVNSVGNKEVKVFRNSAGVLYVATVGNGKLNMYKYSGGTFARKDSGNEPASTGNATTFCIDSDDNIHGFTMTSSVLIRHSIFIADGTTDAWNTTGYPEDVVTVTQTEVAKGLAACVDSSDNLYVLFLDDPTSSSKYQIRLTYKTTSWSTPQTVSQTSTNAYRWPDCTFDKDGNFISSYTHYANNSYVYAARTTNVADVAGTTSYQGFRVYKNGNDMTSLCVDSSTGDHYITTTYSGGGGYNVILQAFKHANAAGWDTWSDISPDNVNLYYNSCYSAFDNSVYYIVTKNMVSGDILEFIYDGSWTSTTIEEPDDYATATSLPYLRWSYYNNPSYATYKFDYVFYENSSGKSWYNNFDPAA